jgi:hypothetical protein
MGAAMGEQGERIYPQSWVACVMVWLLDRFPRSIQKQILESYWTEADIELAQIEAERLAELFGSDCPCHSPSEREPGAGDW